MLIVVVYVSHRPVLKKDGPTRHADFASGKAALGAESASGKPALGHPKGRSLRLRGPF